MARLYEVKGGEFDGDVLEGPPWYEKLPYKAANGYVFDGQEWRWDDSGENADEPDKDDAA